MIICNKKEKIFKFSKGNIFNKKGCKEKSKEEACISSKCTDKSFIIKLFCKTFQVFKNFKLEEKTEEKFKSLKNKIKIKKYLISTLYLKKNFSTIKLIKKSQSIKKKFFNKFKLKKGKLLLKCQNFLRNLF